MAEIGEPLKVEVAYGTAERQSVVQIAWQPGMTARQAAERSGLLAEIPSAEAPGLVLGIYGTRVPDSQTLSPGDRVELCRPLSHDPRDMRRAALAAGKVMGQGE